MRPSNAASVLARVSLLAISGSGIMMILGLAACDSDPGPAAPAPATPGADQGESVQVHQIDALEYERSFQRSLGVSLASDDHQALLDHGLVLTADEYQRHLDRVEALVAKAFADPALRGRILTCAPAGDVDGACTQSIIRQFGALAWQRPVTDSEASRLLDTAATARLLADDFPETVEEVVKATLLSAPFFYRVQGVIP